MACVKGRPAAAKRPAAEPPAGIEAVVRKRPAVCCPKAPNSTASNDSSRCSSKEPQSSSATAEHMLAVVINLKRRPDRWKSFNQRIAAMTRKFFRIERLLATDGDHDVSEEHVGRVWTTDRNGKYDGREGYIKGMELEMTPGERGCAMSHVRAWRRVASMGEETDMPTLILEDDAVFKSNFKKCVSGTLDCLPEDSKPDVLYLGYIKGAPWRRQVATGIHEAEYLWTTVGYLLWPRGAAKLLKALPVDCPVDNFMAWQMSTQAIQAFAVHPPLIDQEGEWDCHSDVPHSDDRAFTS